MAQTEVVNGELRLKKKKKDRRKARKRFLKFLLVIVIISGALYAVNSVVHYLEIKYARSFPAVQNENAVLPVMDTEGNYKFITDRELKIVQITDIHIGGGILSYWKDKKAMNSVAAMISAEKPDLVISTGDMIFPIPHKTLTLNNKNSSEVFIALMDSLGVTWTVCFGNHESEIYNYFNREQIAELYEGDDAACNIFLSGPQDVSGYGNQIIHVENTNGFITRSIYLFDSHAYTESDPFGIKMQYDCIHNDQIEWYSTNVIKDNNHNYALLSDMSPERRALFSSYAKAGTLIFMHIPCEEYRIAVNDLLSSDFADTADTSYIYGSIGEDAPYVYCPTESDEFFESVVDNGAQAIFCGHDHKNNVAVDYKNVWLCYSYSIDYLAYSGIDKIGYQRGCTVIDVLPDGGFDAHGENYYQDKYPSYYTKETVDVSPYGVHVNNN